MGAVNSSVEAAEESGNTIRKLVADECTRWTLDHLRAAHARWQALPSAMSTRAPVMGLNRRQYFEVFTDYDVIVSGAFLCLPMDLFDTFASGSGASNRVFALEVFYLLLVFCDATRETKLQFAFELFDTSKAGYISLPDMVLLLQAVLDATFKVGVTSRVPRTRELEHTAKQLFEAADFDGDDKVFAKEFGEWARRNTATSDVLKQFQEERDTAKKAAKSSLDRDKKARARKRSKHMKHRGSAPGMRKKTVAKGAEGNRPASLSLPALGAAIKSAESKTDEPGDSKGDSGMSYKDYKKRTRTLQLRSIAQRRVLSDLDAITNFTVAELKKLAEQFVDEAKGSLFLSKKSFKRLLLSHVPALGSSSQLVERVFEVIDRDGDGQVNYREVCLALSDIMRGTQEDKLQFIFKLLDDDGSGSIEATELMLLVEHCSQELKDVVAFASEVMKSFDTNGDGLVDIEEFETLLEVDDKLLTLFGTCIKSSRDVLAWVHQLRKINKEFCSEAYRDAVAALSKAGSLAKPTSKRTFLRAMVKNLGFSVEDDAAIDIMKCIYDAVNESIMTDKDITMRDLLMCMLPAISDDRKWQIHSMFRMYDLDGNNTLDENEIMYMLLSAKSFVDAGAHALTEALLAMDSDQDGSITFEEFKQAAHKAPLVRDSMTVLFNLSRDSQIGHARHAERSNRKFKAGEHGVAVTDGMRSIHKRRERRRSTTSAAEILQATKALPVPERESAASDTHSRAHRRSRDEAPRRSRDEPRTKLPRL